MSAGNHTKVMNPQQAVGDPVYLYTVNGNSPVAFALHLADLSIKPLIHDVLYGVDDTLRFMLGNSFAYITIEVFDSVGNLIGKPLWNKMLGSSETFVRAVDLSYLPLGQYSARLTGWRPDGGLGLPVVKNFIQYLCGDVNNDGSLNIADLTHLISHIFSGVSIDAPIERADANGDGSVDIADVTYMIARIFSGGPPPICSGPQ